MKVKDIMTAVSLQYCSPETPLQTVAKAMKIGNCGALPVVDKDKKVVGIVTDRDICLSLTNKQEKPFIKMNVGDIISNGVFTVNADKHINIALNLMRVNKIGRLPVVDNNGKLKGILSMHDLLSSTLRDKEEAEKINPVERNIIKTIKALADSYSLNSQPNYKLRSVSAGRRESWEEAS